MLTTVYNVKYLRHASTINISCYIKINYKDIDKLIIDNNNKIYLIKLIILTS